MAARKVPLYAALVVTLLTAGTLLRVVNLGASAFCCDEYYDVFAARSWLAGDGFRVPGREYTRARLMVLATAASFSAFGESEAAARLPAAAFGIATLAAIYVVGRRLFGRVAGAVALALLAFSPDAIDISRFARLYAALTFCSLLFMYSAFRLLDSGEADGSLSRARRLYYLSLALLTGLLAVHFHPVAATLPVAVGIYTALRWLSARRSYDKAASRWYGLILILAVIGAVAALSVPIVLATLARAAFEPLPWYQPQPGDSWISFHYLADHYGWMWYSVLAATPLVLWKHPRGGVFACLAFWVPFAIVSGVIATKHYRYVLFLLPFAWLILAAAVDVAMQAVSAACRALARSGTKEFSAFRALPVALPTALIVLAAVAASPALSAVLHRVTRSDVELATGFFHDWKTLRAILRPRLEPRAIVVSDVWHAPIYYLGAPTRRLLPAYRDARAGDWETAVRDMSTVVQHEADLVRVHGVNVWIVVSAGRWQRPGYFDPAVRRNVEGTCSRVDVRPVTTLIVFSCGQTLAPYDHVASQRGAPTTS